MHRQTQVADAHGRVEVAILADVGELEIHFLPSDMLRLIKSLRRSKSFLSASVAFPHQPVSCVCCADSPFPNQSQSLDLSASRGVEECREPCGKIDSIHAPAVPPHPLANDGPTMFVRIDRKVG